VRSFFGDEMYDMLEAVASSAREAALALAAQSQRRWRSNAPLSQIDGMAIGIKERMRTPS
jgi:hypothetical protein